MYKILFVCSGNTCRSPMAENIMLHLLPENMKERVSVSSAGVYAGDGYAMTGDAEDALLAHGIVPRPHSSRRLTAEMYYAADKVLVMERFHREVITLIAGDAAKARLMPDFTDAPGDVPDPYGGGRNDYERAYVAIERGCRALVKELVEKPGA